MKHLSKTITAAGATIALVTSSLAVTTSAHAASRDGKCDAGEFCYYHNSNAAGSISDFTGSLGDYGTTQPSCYEFKGLGNGKSLCIKNNAASVWNRSTKTVRVYFNSNYGGAYQDFKSGAKGNLSATLKNENASHQIGLSPSRTMSYDLYKTSGGSITCGFDDYRNVSGRHEGIDIARSVGSDVHALMSGTVTRVKRGFEGGDGLSTIAVYNDDVNKTVIYLHTEPRSSLSGDDSISLGQVIADESWRGVTNKSSAHTHVEMRLGQQTHASVSRDEELVNPDPTSFWNSQGYNCLKRGC